MRRDSSLGDHGRRPLGERVFYLSVSGILLIYGVGTILAILQGTVPSQSIDQVFNIPKYILVLITACAETGISLYLIAGHRSLTKCMLIIWISSVFIAYRVAAWLSGERQPCPCAGALARLPSAGQERMDVITKWILAYFLLGATIVYLRQTVPKLLVRLSVKRRNQLKLALICVVIALLIPMIQVAGVGITRPLVVMPVLIREIVTRFDRTRPATKASKWVALDNVSQDFIKAVLAGEDVRFFAHSGFDWDAIRDSVQQAINEGRPLLGASTITQQSARSLFLWQGRSWIRKGLEAYYTIWMELLLSKRRILELYVNVIEFGDGIYGIEAAAQHYYGKSARDLTREEAAMLAAILPAPRRWNPLAPNRIAKSRWEMILREMDSARLPWDSGLSVVQASASDHEPANAPTKSNPGRENEMATNSSPAATP